MYIHISITKQKPQVGHIYSRGSFPSPSLHSSPTVLNHAKRKRTNNSLQGWKSMLQNTWEIEATHQQAQPGIKKLMLNNQEDRNLVWLFGSTLHEAWLTQSTYTSEMWGGWYFLSLHLVSEAVIGCWNELLTIHLEFNIPKCRLERAGCYFCFKTGALVCVVNM